MINLEQGEEILYTARKHWFIFVSESIFLAVLGVVPFFAIALLEGTNFFQVDAEVWQLAWFAYTIWLLLIWLIVVYIWTDYYLDVWLVTNHRIIDIDQRGLFNRKISTFRHDMIQDATIKVPGLFATLIGFGTIHVRTAGGGQDFEMKGVSKPQRLKEFILGEHDRAREKMRTISVEGVPVETSR